MYITIAKDHDNLTSDIYRKPTATDVIIPNDSCHPKEHRTAAIRYLYNRIEMYNLTPQNRRKDSSEIQQILVNNKYDASTASRLNNTKKQEQDIQKVKWAKFTYVGNETRLITKLFKHTNLKIAFTTDNTIERILSTKHEPVQNKYDKCGIYQLTCPTCKMKYTGQTGRPFKTRFQEHLRDSKQGSNKSRFAQELPTTDMQ